MPTYVHGPRVTMAIGVGVGSLLRPLLLLASIPMAMAMAMALANGFPHRNWLIAPKEFLF